MKIFNIESQLCETALETQLLHQLLTLAKEAGYTIVYDNWGHNASDRYDIDEAIAKFNPIFNDQDPDLEYPI